MNITTDKSADIVNHIVSINGKDYGVLVVTEASVFNLECPACGHDDKGNEIATLDNGQYLYIGNCCGLFTHCEVTQVVTGDEV